jgi:diadenylate cyclase
MYNVINAFFVPGMIVVAIIFHEDIRAFLEKIGALAISLVKIITGKMKMVSGNQETEAITKAVMRLSATKTGALIVLEKNTGVEDICQSGIKINALISHELICNLFFAPAPLHDGAIIIRGKRINSAGCFLPNYSEPGLNSSFGSRHRAAIGMSRLSDAGIIVVSEEDGKISYAYAGELFRGIDAETLREIVEKYYGVSQKHKKEGKDLNESNE